MLIQRHFDLFCGGDVYKPMTTAVCYFTELDIIKHKTPRKLLEKAIDLYGHYKKVYYGRLPNSTIYYISTSDLQEVMEFFES